MPKFLFLSFLSVLLRRLAEPHCKLVEVLEAVRPHVNLNFDNILAHINTIYVLKTKISALASGQGYLRLKVIIWLIPWLIFIFKKIHKIVFFIVNSQGQMLYIAETDLILFQCYPSVMNLDDLTK